MLKIKAETILDMQEEEKHFLKQLTALDNAYVEIGILAKSGQAIDSSGNTSKITLVELATVHEYGSEARNIPQRSFIGATMDESSSKFTQATNKLIDKIIDRQMDSEKALGILGLLIKTAIKTKIRSNISPDLSPATIRRKNAAQIGKAHGRINQLEAALNAKGKLNKNQIKSENKNSDIILTGGKSIALIDTGQLIRSIDYAIQKDGAQGKSMGTVSNEKDEIE